MQQNKIKRFHFNELTSTNDKAKELLKKFNDVIITADYQTKGRGRNKNNWFGSKGNVFFSKGIKHKPEKTFHEVMMLQAIGALAVKNILTEYTGKRIFLLKYPNDVLVKQNAQYLKISGVVTEHSFLGSLCSESIIGIGINITEENFPEELKDKAVSLNHLGIDADTNTITELLNVELEALLNKPLKDVFKNWRDELNIVGKEIFLPANNEKYIVQKLNDNGTLTAKSINNNKIITIDNGDTIRYEYE